MVRFAAGAGGRVVIVHLDGGRGDEEEGGAVFVGGAQGGRVRVVCVSEGEVVGVQGR